VISASQNYINIHIMYSLVSLDMLHSNLDRSFVHATRHAVCVRSEYLVQIGASLLVAFSRQRVERVEWELHLLLLPLSTVLFILVFLRGGKKSQQFLCVFLPAFLPCAPVRRGEVS
jgi:hypothetical protein